MAEPGFWDNQEQAQSLISETNTMKEKSESFQNLSSQLADAEAALELLREEADTDLEIEVTEQVKKLDKSFQNYELSLLLSEKYDNHNALMEIHPGAGGTEAMDWADML